MVERKKDIFRIYIDIHYKLLHIINDNYKDERTMSHSTQSRQIPSFNLEPAYIALCAGALHANLLLTHQPAEPVTAQHSITRNLNVVFVFISTSCVQ